MLHMLHMRKRRRRTVSSMSTNLGKSTGFGQFFFHTLTLCGDVGVCEVGCVRCEVWSGGGGGVGRREGGKEGVRG